MAQWLRYWTITWNRYHLEDSHLDDLGIIRTLICLRKDTGSPADHRQPFQ